MTRRKKFSPTIVVKMFVRACDYAPPSIGETLDPLLFLRGPVMICSREMLNKFIAELKNSRTYNDETRDSYWQTNPKGDYSFEDIIRYAKYE